MSNPIIEILRVGKRYRIGAQREKYESLRDVLAKKLSRAGRRNRENLREFWAIRDVSFQVHEGEALGIIGKNGAGKSTLLKVLSRITPPTEGRIIMRGRVGSLLEVGTGFHPELSGRENVYLNGAILGMTRREVTRKFDEIVAFAECERFLDTPVKRYSSGMYVRLAFAVAAHLEPEILIVDEVLAVGDAEFQRKCLGKMGDAAKNGRTVIFVSHNMSAVMQLCSMCVRLSQGSVAEVGPAADVVRGYLGAVQGTTYLNEGTSTESAYIRRAHIVEPISGHLEYGKPLVIEAEVHSRVTTRLALEVSIRDERFHPIIFLPGGLRFGQYVDIEPTAPQRLICRIPILPLATGNYSVDLILGDGTRAFDNQYSALAFDVVTSDPGGTGRSFTQAGGQGCVHLPAEFTSHHLATGAQNK